MDWIEKLKLSLERERNLLQSAWERAKFARDNAPSASESHSDTTRSEQEKLVSALEVDINRVDQDLKSLAKVVLGERGIIDVWSYVEVEFPGQTIKLVLVTDGMGGKKLDELQLISTASPLGKNLLGKSRGEEFEFRGRKVTVAVVS